jgi:ADP-ribose pyrophosphatase
MIKKGPWKIKKTILKYKNPWIEVNEDRVIRPDGKPGIFGTVKMKSGISVLPIDDKGYVYLTEEYHYALGKKSVEVVSGAVERGEKFGETARRELLEELGIVAKKWISMGVLNPFTTAVKSQANLFLARNLKFTQKNPEGTEIIKMVKIKLDKAAKMVMESKITHGPSCVLILKVNNFLKRLS